MQPSPPPDRPVLVQWLVDTRHLWPEAVQTRQLTTVAAPALAVLLSDEERAGILKFFHVRDAKMALASQLLKHYVVARCGGSSGGGSGSGGGGGGIPWSATHLTRDARTKPVYVDPATGAQPVAFNVSHQAGLVVLAAVYGAPAGAGGAAASGDGFEVGVDIVSPAERRARDRQSVETEGGWPRFVDVYADVFAPGEVQYLKDEVPEEDDSTVAMDPAALPPPPSPSLDLLDRRLRAFYALWCLREAYIKMTGEALLAGWLAELEFREFRAPPVVVVSAAAVTAANASGPPDLCQSPDATITHCAIQFRNHPVDDQNAVNLCLRALGTDYMVCTMVRSPADPAQARALPTARPLEPVSLDAIVAFAERSLQAEATMAAAAAPSAPGQAGENQAS
ncbi:4 -phosphopantetheinyl transferase [Niveomyces insectorum RCEF 264]|uniref:holo-[acyl-carrier-protein] synthase n=1 Tax=Niveomyces insectorum RCEF 264 TaxID=1081102 RepID=A0A167VC23_9HYPO|nr:4 -phosphopantetheinyl transferase [Niveomyces insectorum RCEF 264]